MATHTPSARTDAAEVSAEYGAGDTELYGLVAEFETPEAILDAANAAREAGYKVMDAYSPFPINGLDDALGMESSRLGWVVLIMGITGGLLAFFMQWYAQVVYYPLNIGGRPLNAWPNFIIITFEVTVLFSAFTAGLFMLARNGLPRPYHSIFNTPNFGAASRDRFFLCIETRDPQFDLGDTSRFLEAQGPVRVSEVEV